VRVLSRFALFLLVCAPPFAGRAARQKLAVVALSSPPLMMFTGKSVSEAIAEEAVREGKFEVLGPDQIEKILGREGYQKLLDCGPDVVCASTRLSPTKADKMVVGALSKTETAYRVTIVFADAKSGVKITSIDREILIASRRLKPDVVAATPALLRGEVEATGKLVITTPRAGASVLIDEEITGTTPFTLTVKPGKHKVMVTQDGFVQQDPHYVDVPPGGTFADKVKLFPVPGRELPPEEPKKAVVAEEEKGTFPQWPAWAVLGASAAALTIGGIEGLSVSRFEKTAVDADKNGVIDVTRQQAVEHATTTKIANGCFIGGGIGLGFSAALFYLAYQRPPAADKTAPPQTPKAEVFPTPNGFVVSGRF
jgi:hypothetical protein